jgi:Fe2+ or Zn2+ uptake regulation protein
MELVCGISQSIARLNHGDYSLLLESKGGISYNESMSHLSELQRVAKEKGLRSTTLRTMLLEILSMQTAPCSVPELQLLVKQRGLSPNKTSLYREIDSLHSHGLASVVTMGGVRKVYISAEGGHPHFMCTTCGKSICLNTEAVTTALSQAIAELGTKNCTVEAYDVTIYGSCGSCHTSTSAG